MEKWDPIFLSKNIYKIETFYNWLVDTDHEQSPTSYHFFFFLPMEHDVINFILCVLLTIFDQEQGLGIELGEAQGIC